MRILIVKRACERNGFQFSWILYHLEQSEMFTLFGLNIVIFANKFTVVENIELFPCRQLSPAHGAGETCQMKHFITGFADHVLR